jgi:hypothetical protein
MSDLDDRLRALDEVQEPDLWSAIRAGIPTRSIPTGEPTIRKRLVVAALALLVAAAAGVSVFRWVGSSSPEPLRPVGHPVVVSAASKDGSLRCTATLPSDVLRPGLRPGVQFSLTNVSGKGVRYSAGSEGNVVVKDPSGRVLWDPRLPGLIQHGGGFRKLPQTLPPGTTAMIPTSEPPIWWGGRLSLDVSCLGLSLGSIPVRVFASGHAPSPEEALDRALARTGGLFNGCHPATDGSWKRGAMSPPDGADLTPLPVRCSAQVVRHAGFDAVAIKFVSPPDAPEVKFPDDIYQLSNIEGLPGTGSIEAGRWLFVVTANAVREVSGLDTLFRLRGGEAMAPQYRFERGGWFRSPIMCDSEGLGGGVLFLSLCPA